MAQALNDTDKAKAALEFAEKDFQAATKHLKKAADVESKKKALELFNNVKKVRDDAKISYDVLTTVTTAPPLPGAPAKAKEGKESRILEFPSGESKQSQVAMDAL